MNIEYPDKFEFKVIKNEGVGGSFESVKLIAPTITKPSRSFELKKFGKLMEFYACLSWPENWSDDFFGKDWDNIFYLSQ
jgi:hypothetical protein